MKVHITEEADVNVRDIALYIAKSSGSKTIAKKVLSRIGDSVERISEMPEIGRDGRKKGTREFSVPRLPYIIVYKVGRSRIDILAVIHGARNRQNLTRFV